MSMPLPEDLGHHRITVTTTKLSMHYATVTWHRPKREGYVVLHTTQLYECENHAKACGALWLANDILNK